MASAPAGLPVESLGSLWKHKTDGDADKHFVCSGVIVASGWVLTVKHAFVKGRTLWIKPYSDFQPYNIIGEPQFHPTLDVALVRIEVMPPRARAADCDHASVLTRSSRAHAQQGQKSIPLSDGVPAELHRAMSIDDASLGERCVEGLMGLASRLAVAMAARDIDLPPAARVQLRERMFEAMGCAAKLYLDLDAVPAPDSAELEWDIAAQRPEGATLVAREQSDQVWRATVRAGRPVLHDPLAIQFPLEMGEGEDAQRELTKLAGASVSVTNEVPVEIAPEVEREIRGLLHVEAFKGRARMVVLPAKDRDKFTPALRAWAKTMKLGLIALKGNDGRLFLFNEELLLAKLQDFVRSFNESPEWKT